MKKRTEAKCEACRKVMKKDWYFKVYRNYCDECRKVLNTINGGRDLFREVIRIRFKRTCQKCKMKWDETMRRFDVHHLGGECGKKSRKYDRSKTNFNKFTVLCHKCHMGTHGKGGKDKIKEQDVERMREMIWEGKSYDTVGKAFGVSYAAVFYKLNGRESKQLL